MTSSLELGLELDAGIWDPAWETSAESSESPQSLDLADARSLYCNAPSLDMLRPSFQPTSAPKYPDFTSPPIPMDSYIRVPRYSFHAASIENAFILGIPWDRIKIHKCGQDPLSSPWMSQSVGIEPDDATIVPDLRPSANQRKHNHELYIDTLPFKEFRDKVLALRAVDPPIFNEKDFILDLDYRNAMQCWGPTPWENKSWEVQQWFLKKWWMITGGENGEMAACSRWWTMLRGETV